MLQGAAQGQAWQRYVGGEGWPQASDPLFALIYYASRLGQLLRERIRGIRVAHALTL
jgi:hypothetical protein